MSSPKLRYFAYEHLPPSLQAISKPIGDLVATNDAIYLDRDAPGQSDRMTFSNLEADADGYVTAKHDPT